MLTRVPDKTHRQPVVVGRGAVSHSHASHPTEEKSDEDPCAQEDPWSKYRARRASNTGTACAASAQPGPRPADPANAARIQALEHGLATLQAQQAQASKDRAHEK